MATSDIETIDTDVLVVGAGPAGLTAASLLALLGVDALTVTKYGTANSPRAHITNQRAVEILRVLGIEDRVQRRALSHEQMGTQVFATAFAGRELSRMMTWGTGDDRIGDYRAASPTAMCNIPQHILEPIMLERAGELGADVRLHHEVVEIRQFDDHVRAVVRPRNGGTEFAVVAKYAIGCDGARTVVGRDGEFEWEGTAGKGHAITVWIEADLAKYTAHRPGALFVTVTPGSEDFVSVWTCIEPFDEWSTIFMRPGLAEHDLDASDVADSVRAAIGTDDVEFTIKHVSPWEFNHVVATHYRRGRLFIAGDAAHRHPPANGLGSNTSMQDSFNLAWKLALAVRSQAGDALLDTYNDERQPVGRQIVDRANKSVDEMAEWFGVLGVHPGMTPREVDDRIDTLFGPHGGDERAALLAALDQMNWQFNAHGVELGQRYTSSAVVPDGTAVAVPTDDPELHHTPSTRPGSPLPHVWLAIGDDYVSTLDLCSYDRFTLIVGADGAVWTDAAATISDELGVEIAPITVSLGCAVNDVFGHWIRRREVGDDGCLLVRPDRIVAWRSHGSVDDPTAALRAAMSQVVGVPAPQYA
ncbi:MAG: FAD-dependent monooxygenase [Actinomycetota bacterium]